MSIVEDLCKAAAGVKYDVQKLSTEQKNRALLTAAEKGRWRSSPIPWEK